MVLGKKFDPAGDEMYKKVQEIEKKSLDVEEKLSEVRSEVKDLESGHLPSEHHDEALRSLLKRCKGGTEEFMRQLETLDSLRFDEGQQDAKRKRKSVVDQINSRLDVNEEVQKKIERLSDSAKRK